MLSAHSRSRICAADAVAASIRAACAAANHLQDFEATEWRLDDELRTVLSEGKLTYSDYATARQAILVNGTQMIHQYYAAVLAGDRRAMAAVDANYERVIVEAERYIRTVRGGAAPTPPPLAQASGAAAPGDR